MVEVNLVDTARKVDPNLICPRDLSDVQPGGLGVNIISEVMDEMVFMDRPDGRSGNLLRLRRKLT
jgi:sigma-B regulation protein RsbU (phosphoserine phosphatase)